MALALYGVPMSRTKDLAFLQWCIDGAQLFSTCAKRQYMAIVVGANGRVVGTGYNGSAPGLPHCNEGHCPRLHEGSAPGSSYSNCIAVHAEANALMFSDRTAREYGTLYVNGPPCWDCGKLIAASGVRRLVHLTDPSYENFDKVALHLRHASVVVISIDREELQRTLRS